MKVTTKAHATLLLALGGILMLAGLSMSCQDYGSRRIIAPGSLELE